MEMNTFDEMTNNEVKKDSYMIWCEINWGCGACGGTMGQWYSTKDKRQIKDLILAFIKENSEVITKDSGEVIDISDLAVFKKEVKEVLKQKEKNIDVEHCIDTISKTDEYTMKELNLALYELTNILDVFDIDITMYAFGSPIEARCLVKSHGSEFDYNNLDITFKNDFIG